MYRYWFIRLLFATSGLLFSLLALATTPIVTGITSSNANATYNAGASVSIQITFDQSVTVTGFPTLALNSGGTATYASGSPGTVLSFTYAVGATDSSTDLDYTSTNALSGTIQLTSDLTAGATLTLPPPGAAGSLGANKAIVITDNTAPTLAAASIVANNSIQPNTIQLTFSEALSQSEATNASNYTVTNNGATITYTLDSVSVNSNVVTLTLATADPNDTKTYITNSDVMSHIKVTPASAIVDANNVAYAAGTVTEAGATHSKDSTSPTLNNALAATTNTTVVLTFGEKVSKTAATTVTNYTISGTGGLTGNPTAATLNTAGTQVTLVIPTMTGLADGKTVIVTAATAITDLAGNTLSSSARTATLTINRTPTLSFTPVIHASPSSLVESEAVTLSGLNVPTPISVATNSSSTLRCAVLPAGETAWGSFATCTTLTVSNGDKLKLQLTASNTAANPQVSATISIAGVSGNFSVTTAPSVVLPTNVTITTLSSLTAVISNPPSDLYISMNGLAMVPPTVTNPIELMYGAPSGTGFLIQNGATANFMVGGAFQAFKASGADTIAVLKSFEVDGYPGLPTLEISSGQAIVTGSLGLAPIASILVGTTAKKQVVLQPNGAIPPVVEVKRNIDGTTQVAVKSGKIDLRLASADSKVTLADAAATLFNNEVATLSSTGLVTRIRIGSLDEKAGTVGDPLSFATTSLLPKPTILAKIPRLDTVHERAHASKPLMESLFDFIGPRASLTQAYQGTWGQIPLRLDGIPLYLTPIGDVFVDTARNDGVVLADDGRYEVSRNGVTARLAASMADLGEFAITMSAQSNAAVLLQTDGSLEISENGSTRIMQPDLFTFAVQGENDGTGHDLDGIFRYVRNNLKQRLFPRFYNMALLATTFASLSDSMTLRDNMDGTVTAILTGATSSGSATTTTTTYTLAPSYNVLSPIGGVPPEHRNDPWWVGIDSLIYLKYPNGSAQGFTVR